MDIVPGIWKEERLIESFDVDVLGRLHPQTLFAYLLNAAWNHAKGTSYGHDELAARNLMWVLVKVQMLIKRLPRWGERITIETWGKRIVRLYALRDFSITSGTGRNWPQPPRHGWCWTGRVAGRNDLTGSQTVFHGSRKGMR